MFLSLLFVEYEPPGSHWGLGHWVSFFVRSSDIPNLLFTVLSMVLD